LEREQRCRSEFGIVKVANFHLRGESLESNEEPTTFPPLPPPVMSQAQIERRLTTHAKVAKKRSLFTRVAAQKQFTPPPGRVTVVGPHSYAIKPSVAEFSPASQWELLDDNGSVDGQLFVGGNATFSSQRRAIPRPA